VAVVSGTQQESAVVVAAEVVVSATMVVVARVVVVSAWVDVAELSAQIDAHTVLFFLVRIFIFTYGIVCGIALHPRNDFASALRGYAEVWEVSRTYGKHYHTQ
jgi:hypothetical protein